MDNRFKINESLDIDRHISKIEEDHAYLYIKKVLVPVASKVWNKSCQGSKLFINFTVTPEQICRNIKKVGHWKFSPNDKTTTDVIRYESDFPGDFNKKFSGPFRFEIYKSVSGGKLVASLKIPSGEENHYEVGEPVNENIKIQKDVNSEPPISKMEEYKALDFIKKKIVPIALMSYNKYFRQPRFTPFKLEDIVKNLKKINIDFPTTIPKDIVAIHSAYDPRITYGFEMGGEKWAFIIFKSLTNRKMYATWRHPYFSGRKFYHVGDPLNEGLESNKDAEVPERLKMTRRDEAEGLQFIRNLIYRSYQVRPKNLKRVEDKTPSLSFMASPNPIRFSTDPSDPDGYFNFVILKIGGKIYIKNDAPKKSSEKYIYPLDYTGKLIEKALL
jgi:hypothetical protein